jgi:transposase
MLSLRLQDKVKRRDKLITNSPQILFKEVSMINYIGIDISKQILHINNGEKYLKFKHTKKLNDFKKWLSKNYDLKNIVLIFEATGGYSKNLIHFCYKNKMRMYQATGEQTYNYAKSIKQRGKSDKKDAYTIWKMHRIIDEKDIIVPKLSKITEKLNNAISQLQLHQKTRVAFTNQISSLKNEQSIINDTVKTKNILIKKEEKIINKIKKFIKNNEKIYNDFKNLQTISGVGEILAMNLLAFFLKFPNANRKEITALAGLDVIKKQSGTSVNTRGRITKKGNHRIREKLFFGTMTATRFNKIIKKFYDRLVNKSGKKKKVALIACMRKLLLIAFQIFKNKTQFDPDYNEKKGKNKSKSTNKFISIGSKNSVKNFSTVNMNKEKKDTKRKEKIKMKKT